MTRRGPIESRPSPGQRLHELARQVERLSVAGRTDPETILLAKLDPADALHALARELEAAQPRRLLGSPA